MLFSDAKEAVAAITNAVKEMEEAQALKVGEPVWRMDT